MSDGDAAAAVVARELAARPCEARTAFLKQLLAHAAAGLVLVEGERAAGESVYRLADAMVARGAA
ncbi:hypothetical protein [Phenylobacterium sp.]|jgi:hypothetical protein|uniref:hypothetical protein n=1 Tax=Phenylobacterium sp. TaxID=1871053 RepID=UPI003783C72B